MRKRQYVIYRHGANSAERLPLGIVEAATWRSALNKAKKEFTLYNNQYLSAFPKSFLTLSLYGIAPKVNEEKKS